MTQTAPDTSDLTAYCNSLAEHARTAALSLSSVPGRDRDASLLKIADAIDASRASLQQDNKQDLAAGREAGLSSAMLDRLELTDKRIDSMISSLKQVAAQPDPVGQVDLGRVLPNGIRLQKVRVPIGVVLIIFESRPNVTCDAAALCIKSGNAVILRGGKEAAASNAAIARCVRQGLTDAGLPADAVQLVQTTDRAAIGNLLAMQGRIDLCIPRGGEGLIRAVVEQARIPVIKHYTGNCHTYVHEDADPDMAISLCVNAKIQRPGVCNATETFIFHSSLIEAGLMRRTCDTLIDKGVELRGDERACDAVPVMKPATDEDWGAEYLDMIAAVKVVDTLDEAVAHINAFGSRHTDAIITQQLANADRFIATCDTANAMVNCSTRFSDGGEYGLGAEIGISTDKLHARGPMGADDLTTYQWVAMGSGQCRG